MDDKDLDFLVGEYLRFWDELGLEEGPAREGVRGLVGRAPAGEDAQPATLDRIRRELGDGCGCVRAGGDKIVFGAGNPRARLVFVGEAPGAEDAQRGAPYRGPAGELLTKIVEAMGFTRDQVYITHLVKCRPAESAPDATAVARCAVYLHAQLAAIGPRCVVALGQAAASELTGQSLPIAEARGAFRPLVHNSHVAVMPTYSPEWLLQQPAAKKQVWEDMKQVVRLLGESRAEARGEETRP
jgi:DNA polymerase